MKEYIEREAILNKQTEVYHWDGLNDSYIDFVSVEAICSIPAADVEPVRHGRWLDTDTFDFHRVHIYQCSNCGKEVADDYIDNHKFCLHCGAKMDGGN